MNRIFRSLLIGVLLAAGAEVFIRLSPLVRWPPIIDLVISPGLFLRMLFYACGGSPKAMLEYAREWMIYQFWIDTVWYGTLAWIWFWWRERRRLKFA